MNKPTRRSTPARYAPPNRHHLALMIWLSVVPTLMVLNLTLGSWLHTLPAGARTFVLATLAVPIVNYVLMPQLHRIRGLLLSRPSSRLSMTSAARTK